MTGQRGSISSAAGVVYSYWADKLIIFNPHQPMGVPKARASITAFGIYACRSATGMRDPSWMRYSVMRNSGSAGKRNYRSNKLPDCLGPPEWKSLYGTPRGRR